ncbi:MAG: DUF3089 domain-containing protein [Muribaculaceae bacterium]|nr:DUF3089 domain-containing protein [Muribaculaceae bacterium]
MDNVTFAENIKMKSINCLSLLILGCSLSIIGCSNNNLIIYSEEKVYVPEQVDYSDQTMWHIYNNDSLNTGADIFYIPSTWEYDWYPEEGVVCHFADPSRADHRADMSIEIEGIADYMAEGNNFYSPFYRHISLNSWATLNEDTIKRRFDDVAFEDIKNAFDLYYKHHNEGRPFILAGFSQGGKAVVELLKTFDKSKREAMVAAYVMGYKVTPDDVVVSPWLIAAKDSLDTGVIICYNSVSDVRYVKPIVASPNVMAINPVNWKTDSTPAVLNDTIGVTLDAEFNVLVVNGYDGSSLPNILDILNVGDYHGAEPWLYSECLKRNIKQRIQSFRKIK